MFESKQQGLLEAPALPYLKHCGAESLEQRSFRPLDGFCNDIVKFVYGVNSCALKTWHINLRVSSLVKGKSMLQTVGGRNIRAHYITGIADLRRPRVAAAIWRV
jgi:hypothetical protein